MGDDDKNTDKKSDNKAEISVDLKETAVLSPFQQFIPVHQKVAPQNLNVIIDLNFHNSKQLHKNDNPYTIFPDSVNIVRIRNRPVERIYMKLSAQVLFTFMVLFLIAYEPNSNQVLRQHALTFLNIGAVLFFVPAIPLIYYGNLKLSSLLNNILLALMVLGMILLLSEIVAYSSPMIVIVAVEATTLITVVVSIFAIHTKWDVTLCSMFLCIATYAILFYGMILIVVTFYGIYLKVLHIIYSVTACLLSSFLLMYHTQMTLRRQKTELSTVTLYHDIMTIFLLILALY